MQTDALGRAVINGHEDKGRPLRDGHRGRHVRTPHHVGRLSGDGPVVRLRPVRVTRTGRGLEVVCAHQPPHPLLRGAPPLDPQRRPHLSVALAMKRRSFEHPTNVGHQDVIRGGADRTAADDTSPGTRSPDASHTRWSGRSGTRGRPAARHTPDGWRSNGRHSSRRPPPGQRDAGLQVVHFRVEQLVLHQQFSTGRSSSAGPAGSTGRRGG